MFLRLFSLLLFVGVLAAPASATWSIILVDTRTGEIAVASATCLERFDLAVWVPIVVVGKGGACAQSYVDPSGANRLYIRDEFKLGTDPAQILAQLAIRDPGHQTRQYGMVDSQGRAIGFSGTGAGAWAGDRTGRMGDIVYAIQGNVLTGPPVLAAAELAIWNTKGDLAEKLMAAMEAARLYGGDGRCSCTGSNPTGCGAPPASFKKSAHVGFMLIARLGDVDGNCNPSVGCASGKYYMRLNVANQVSVNPDPVQQLRQQFDGWKQQQQGRPDHLLSTVTFANPNLPNDGRSRTTATIVLHDREGNRIRTGGAKITAALDPQSPATVTFGNVKDNGDGSYELPVIAGFKWGVARMQITVDDGSGGRLLAPFPEIDLVTDRLWVNRAELSVTAGGTMDFSLQPGPVLGGDKAWVLLASNSGTSPGIYVPPFIVIPLNPDPLFFATVNAAFRWQMPELVGVFPSSGRAWTGVTFPPGAYGLPLGSELAFSFVLWSPLVFASNAVKVKLVQ